MQIRNLRLPAACFTLLLGIFAFAPAASAISVVPPTFTGLVDKADSIVQGEVVDTESKWVVNDAGYRLIKTFVTVRVAETAKGESASSVVLVFLGGTVGDQTMSVGGMPTFTKGERAWFFVHGNGRFLCPLAYADHGAYLLRRDPVSGEDRVTRLSGETLHSTADIGAEPARPKRDMADSAAAALTSAQFGQAITQELRHLEAQKAINP